MKKQTPRHRGHGNVPVAKHDRGYVVMEHPLSGIDPAEIREGLARIGEKQAKEFPEVLAGLLGLLRAKYPPHLIATLAGFGLHAGITNEGVSDKTLIPSLEQHHIEFLQALVLTLPSQAWGVQPASSEDIQSVLDALTKLTQAFYQRRYRLLDGAADLQARTVLGLQERLRLHTQVVRNWGFFTDVLAISTELYAPLDERFRKSRGYGLTDLIGVARCLVSTFENRNSDHLKLLRRLFRSDKISTIVRRFFREYPHVEGDPDAVIRSFPPGTSRETVIARLLSHASIALPGLAVFKPVDLGPAVGLPAAVTSKVLDDLSLQPGALQDHDAERLFLDNPVWRFPAVRMGDAYFCATPQVIFSHLDNIIRSLAEETGLKTALEDRRAEYLEQKVEEMLGAALPAAEFKHRVKWRVGEQGYETDHFAALDRTILIVEDKSAALTAPGLRGAPKRVKRHVRDLIFEPSEQSARLEAMIWRARTGDVEAVANLAPFGVDFSQIERVVRISVTLDDFSVLASSEREFKEAGWIPTEAALAPVLNIADLQYVIEILERPALILHYFAERARVQKTIDMSGFELDFLGFYLATGFNISGFEAEQPRISVIGMSLSIDRYYNNRDAGIVSEKPKPKLRPFIANLVRAIEQRGRPGWLGVSIDLLQAADYEEQKLLFRMLDQLKANVEANWRDPKHNCSVILTPPEIRDVVIVFYVFPAALYDRRKEIADKLIATAMEDSGRARCVLISRCTDAWDDPYSFIITARRADALPVERPVPEAGANA